MTVGGAVFGVSDPDRPTDDDDDGDDRDHFRGGLHLGAKFPNRGPLCFPSCFLLLPFSGQIRRDEKAFPGAIASCAQVKSPSVVEGTYVCGCAEEGSAVRARGQCQKCAESGKSSCRRFNFPHRIRFYFSLATLSE